MIPDPQTHPTIPIWDDDETQPCAARALGISRASAYAAAKTGELPVLRLGRRVVVPTAWLRRALQLDGAAA